MPTLTIFAGINGAGKTTLYNNLISHQQNGDFGVRVCPDDIVREFNGDWRNQSDQINAVRETITRIRTLITKRQSFAWETSIISNFALKTVEQAKAMGFKVFLNFIYVRDVKTSLDRIEQRVKYGGHGVPEKIVLYKYKNQLRRMPEMIDLCDSTLFFENIEYPKHVASYSKASNLFMLNTSQSPELIKFLRDLQSSEPQA